MPPSLPPLLKDVNPHFHDNLIRFVDEGHKYFYLPTGQRIRKSMTGMLKPLFETFDGPAIALAGVPKWKRNEENKYHELCKYLSLVMEFDDKRAAAEINKMWVAFGNVAAGAGTEMHERLELYIQGRLPPPNPEEPAPMEVAAYIGWKESFYPEMKLEPWRCEFVCVLVVDGIPVVSGSIDLIMKDKNGRYWLVDWKHTNPKKKGLLGKRKQEPLHWKQDKAKGPFAEYDADDYHKYSAQLLGYKYILTHGGYDMEIAGCFIVQIHEDLPRANCVEVAELDDEVDAMFAAEIALAKQEKAAGKGPHEFLVDADF